MRAIHADSRVFIRHSGLSLRHPRIRRQAGSVTAPATWVEDLLHNARRRAAERRFGDAVARLYRAFEALAQVHLREKHDIPDTKAVPLEKLPESLRPDWTNRARDGRLMLGLQDAFHVLDACGNELGRKFLELSLADERKSPLVARNHSILAHGFQPVTNAVYDQLHEKLRSLLPVDAAEPQDWRLPTSR